ncbi:MAG: ABC transporter permease [Bifidobacteriaceae bacterium]|nr:ABC transporter permease [Bifidobacteriaceae bacterium]
MLRYALRRLGQAAIVLWTAYTVTFVLLFLLPTDPVETMLGARGDSAALPPEQMAQLRAAYGFDKPALVQYVTRGWAALHGDFGNSMATGAPADGEVLTALPYTLTLASAALSLAILLGFSLALGITYTRSRLLKGLLSALPPLSVSAPTFWLGLVLIQLFSFKLGWLPAFGDDGWQSVVLPAVTLAIPVSAGTAQVLAQSLHDQWSSPFIDVARAKGASRGRLLFKHALRNSVSPALAVIGMSVGGVLAGSVVTETIFSRNGIGRLTQQAVTLQDIPVVQAVVVFAAVVFVGANLLVDLLQMALDPRVRTAQVRVGT